VLQRKGECKRGHGAERPVNIEEERDDLLKVERRGDQDGYEDGEGCDDEGEKLRRDDAAKGTCSEGVEYLKGDEDENVVGLKPDGESGGDAERPSFAEGEVRYRTGTDREDIRCDQNDQKMLALSEVVTADIEVGKQDGDDEEEERDGITKSLTAATPQDGDDPCCASEHHRKDEIAECSLRRDVQHSREKDGDSREPDDEGWVGLREMRAVWLGAREKPLRLEEVGDLIVSELRVVLPNKDAGEEDGDGADGYKASHQGYPDSRCDS
jgi:hypothetical protein